MKNEANKVTADIHEKESNEVVLSDINDVDNSRKQLCDASDVKQPEECGNENEKLPNVISLAATVEDVLSKDNMSKATVDKPIINDQAVVVIDIPEQADVIIGTTNTDGKPCFIDAATQVEISDNNTTHSNCKPAGSQITSDPMIPALLDELSALK